MKKLTYDDYSNYYASKCTSCKGEKRVQIKGVWTICICQNSASLKFKFEQFEVDPPELKYKTWSDFDGHLRDGKGGKYLGIDASSFFAAKQKAGAYCFNVSDIEIATADRKKHLIVHQHRYDGQNLIIVGNKNSGRTLIASLVIKEAAYACRIHNLDISFKYIKSHDVLEAARWSNERMTDRPLLDEMADVDFLVIDEIDLLPDRGHHTMPPDYYTMNVLFGNRLKENLPTILICSENFWTNTRQNPHIIDSVTTQWGKPFMSILNDPSNVVIELKKGANVG